MKNYIEVFKRIYKKLLFRDTSNWTFLIHFHFNDWKLRCCIYNSCKIFTINITFDTYYFSNIDRLFVGELFLIIMPYSESVVLWNSPKKCYTSLYLLKQANRIYDLSMTNDRPNGSNLRLHLPNKHSLVFVQCHNKSITAIF